jgi:hypothetical protein
MLVRLRKSPRQRPPAGRRTDRPASGRGCCPRSDGPHPPVHRSAGKRCGRADTPTRREWHNPMMLTDFGTVWMAEIALGLVHVRAIIGFVFGRVVHSPHIVGRVQAFPSVRFIGGRIIAANRTGPIRGSSRMPRWCMRKARRGAGICRGPHREQGFTSSLL